MTGEVSERLAGRLQDRLARVGLLEAGATRATSSLICGSRQRGPAGGEQALVVDDLAA
jgi:hypothetical protein